MPSGGVSGPPGPDPLPEEVSKGDDEISSGSPGSGITVNGSAITGSSIVTPRVPPYANARLAPMLAARFAELLLDKAVHADEAEEALLCWGVPLMGCRDLGGFPSPSGSLFIVGA